MANEELQESGLAACGANVGFEIDVDEVSGPSSGYHMQIRSRTPVQLIKDSEFGDRFWLRGSAQGQMVEYVILGNDMREFAEAIEAAVLDLEA
jgi:hypothetical protein